MYETATHQAARIARERAEAEAKLAKLKLDYANSPEERVRVAREDLARLKSDPYPLQRGSQDIAALERQVKVDKRNFAAAAGRMTEHETLDMAFDRSKPNRCFHGQMNMRRADRTAAGLIYINVARGKVPSVPSGVVPANSRRLA